MSVITTDITRAIFDLNQSKPVAIPTETVYGLAALIDKPDAIKSVFAMKGRPLNHPLIIHVAQGWDLSDLVAEVPDYAQILMAQFWPGPLTLVFRSKVDQINPLITGGQSTVAIRCPAHPLAQELLTKLNVPVVAPSANPFGKISPTTALHVQNSFGTKDLLILDGGRCSIGIESTIIDATHPDTYQILRHGLIDEQAIKAVIATKQSNQKNETRVPGKLESHYQPQKQLYYFSDYASLVAFCRLKKESIYVIASQKPEETSLFYPLSNKPENAAYDLYFQLREADTSPAQCIAIELPPNKSEWLGIRERILKAGTAYQE